LLFPIHSFLQAVFRAPQHPQLRGAADRGRGRKGVGKISIRIKTCNSWYTQPMFL